MTTAADDSAVEGAFEALLAGRPVPEGAAGLAAFTGAVRASATRPGRPNAALAELLATGLLSDQSSPSARTARSAGAPPSRRDTRIRNRRRFAMFFPALIAKLLTAGAAAQAATGATVVVVVAFAGAGAVGVLPGPAQDTYSSIVSEEEVVGDEAPVDEAPLDETPVDEVPIAETPLEVPAEEPVVDEATTAVQEWMAQPVDGAFGAWVTQARHDPELRAAIEASGHPFGYWVSQRAQQKGITEQLLADEGVTLDELTTVPALPTEVATVTGSAVPPTADATPGNSGKAGAGSKSSAGGNAGANGNAKSNGRN